MANKKQGKIITVCVLGLSGYDITEKCLFGVGKSCFCNRFVRPHQDEYNPDHTSIYSTSDFVGTVINKDHFLYWGTVVKYFDENASATFRVIEQTEFIDDASYNPLSIGGQVSPYTKRATTTKLLSQGKLMYISRDQVALQNDYEQKKMDPDGKVQVDGFICCYDVSKSLAEKLNHTELQENTLANLLTMIHKSKKPVVVVATKCDSTNEQILQRAHQFVQSKKLSTPLVECSSENDVNIDLSFQAILYLMDSKNKNNRPKFISYQDGLISHNSKVKEVTEKYLNVVNKSAADSSLLGSWNEFKKIYSNSVAFEQFALVCGSLKAKQLFNQQAKKIKRHYEDKKLNEYLNKLPEALDELLPSLQFIEANEWNWENCQQSIKNHIAFNKWFYILPKNVTWNSPEQLFIHSDEKIPFDVLQVERSRACFDRHIKKLKESARKVRMKGEFRKLLELTTAIRPGTSWLDIVPLIKAEESYKYLDENERKIIFETYLRDITYQARMEFQELLFESASKFSKLSKEARPTDIEMKEISEYLREDARHKNLENIGNARDILLFNHIALMQSPNRCLSGPEKCMDRLMQQVVESTTRRNALNPYENDLYRENEDEQISILVIGKNGLAQELQNKIKTESSSYDSLEYIVDGQIYGLNLKTHDEKCQGDDELLQVISSFKPQGYLAIFSNMESLQYLQTELAKIQENNATLPLSLPLIIVLANEKGLQEDKIPLLRQEGFNLVNKMECVFVDYPYTVSLMDDPIHHSQVQDAIRGIVDVINKRSRPPSTPTSNGSDAADIRILLCAMCGDEYPVELILGTMLQPHACYSNPEQQDTIMIEAMLGNVKKTIAVTLTSYHRAYSLKNHMFHGYILAYSATRLASLETLRAFASSLPHVPVQVLAVTGSSSGASIIFHDDNTTLFNDSSNMSSKLAAKFQSNTRQAGAFVNFFDTVHDRKTLTELTIQGVRKRREGPLPDVPSQPSPADLIPNGDISKGSEADSPYVEVALRHSYVHQDSDSMPSTPEQNRSMRSRSSTIDSRDDIFTGEVKHDHSGLYAIVDKKRFSYIKKVEKFSEDDDDDMIWKDNEAYDSVTNSTPQRVSVSSTLDSPQLNDRPYATVPFLPKGHRAMVHDYEKFATLPAESSKKTNWTEPSYETIENIKAQMGDKGYEPDSLSSISSKSKESQGSQLELRDLKPYDNKKHFPSPATTSPLFYLHDEHDPNKEKAAPLAKPDDDEQEDIKELRKTLEETFVLVDQSTPQAKIVKPVVTKPEGESPKKSDARKSRSESNFSTNSLDPKATSLFGKIMRKVTPNPSPGNSDAEHELQESSFLSTSGKKKRRSIRKRKPSPPPAVLINGEEPGGIKERSYTMPQNSPKPTPKVSTLEKENRRHRSLFRKFTADLGDASLNVPENNFTTQTLDRNKRHKKIKEMKPKTSKDDLDLPQTDTVERKKPKIRKPLSMRFKRPPNNEKEMQRRLREYEAMKDKNQKFKNSNYFGKPLTDICPNETLCPIFVEEVIKHVEDYGMQNEGIYRLSGNKNDIETVMEKFEANPSICLGDLGVSVHAITGALKQFFKLLPEPLIPTEFRNQINEIMIIMDAAERLKQLRKLVIELPQPNLEIFKRFTQHLNKITEYKNVNKMDVRNLQTVLYPTLMRANFDSLTNMSQNMNMGLFIQTCIEQADNIFDIDIKETKESIIEDSKELEFDEKLESNEKIDDAEIDSEIPKIEITLNKTDSSDGFEIIGSENDMSFSESVLSHTGVGNIIKTPKIEISTASMDEDSDECKIKADINVKEEKSRKSMETEIN